MLPGGYVGNKYYYLRENWECGGWYSQAQLKRYGLTNKQIEVLPTRSNNQLRTDFNNNGRKKVNYGINGVPPKAES